jgi:cytochrome c biogenesis protein CcmG, thiol:disulfide interchange protein DsbE
MGSSEERARSPLRMGAQIVAVAAVLGLLGLLAWKVVNQGHSKIPQQVAKNKHPAAPDFTLDRIGRPGELSLASFKGKAVILNFWASWCGPCRDEVPRLEAAWKRLHSKGLVVLGIDYDDLSGDARSFMRRYGMTYPAVHDGRKKTVAAYGVTGVPETYFVNRQGKLVGEHVLGAVSKTQLAEGIRKAMKS